MMDAMFVLRECTNSGNNMHISFKLFTFIVINKMFITLIVVLKGNLRGSAIMMRLH